VNEHGILFSSAMVRAILDGRKTQTMRVIRHPHIEEADIFSKAADDQGRWEFGIAGEGGMFTHGDFIRCPYGEPGDERVVVELRRIPRVDSKYEAGSDGRIYSRSGGNTNARKEKPFPLQQATSSTGYPIISLTGEQRRGSVAVHSLICAAFHGEPPTVSSEVRHLDGDKSNSRPENLRWGTRAENEADKRRHRTAATGARHGSAKLTDDDVSLIRKVVGMGLVTATRSAEFYGVLPSTIRDIANDKTWRSDSDAPEAPPPGYAHIRLRLESVTVQRLQAISENDARAEGVEPVREAVTIYPSRDVRVSSTFDKLSYRPAFIELWDSINGKRAPWSSNCWCWCLTFRRLP
jgi:hypothetical protein